jgi:hypothetical protein
MDLKVGANGDLSVSVSSAGDIVISLVDNEADSSQSANIALHPQVLGAALVKAMGGSALAGEAVNFVLAALQASLKASP